MMYPTQMTVLNLCSHVGVYNASSLKESMAGLNLSIYSEIFCCHFHIKTVNASTQNAIPCVASNNGAIIRFRENPKIC